MNYIKTLQARSKSATVDPEGLMPFFRRLLNGPENAG
jgi:hypothetical protein